MAWIHWPPPKPGSCPPAAVAVWLPDGSHTGVVFTDENDKLRIIHLASHFDLRCEEVRHGKLGWVLPAGSIPRERLELVAAMCERIWVRCQESKLPYGFRYNASRFHENGELELGTDECGLTCATFVLAVYQSVGLELLQLSSWPNRDDDERRFTSILAVLRQAGADEKHIEAVSKETKSVRYRPLEVAGGSCFSPPAKFEDAAGRAVTLSRELALPSKTSDGGAS